MKTHKSAAHGKNQIVTFVVYDSCWYGITYRQLLHYTASFSLREAVKEEFP